MILHGAPSNGEWSIVDRTLALAHTLAADMVCPGCGQPKHEAYNPDAEGYYTVQEATCQGCAAAARDADGHKEHEHERKVWVVNERPPDVQLMPWTPGT